MLRRPTVDSNTLHQERNHGYFGQQPFVWNVEVFKSRSNFSPHQRLWGNQKPGFTVLACRTLHVTGVIFFCVFQVWITRRIHRSWTRLSNTIVHERGYPIGYLMSCDQKMFLDIKMAATSSCSVDEAIREALRFFPSVVKEKQKKCISLLWIAFNWVWKNLVWQTLRFLRCFSRRTISLLEYPRTLSLSGWPTITYWVNWGRVDWWP